MAGWRDGPVLRGPAGVRVPAPLWWLTTGYDSLYWLLWAPGTHAVQTYMQTKDASTYKQQQCGGEDGVDG